MAGMGEPSLVLWSNIFLCAAEVVSSVSQFSVDLSHIAEQNPVSWTSVAVLVPRILTVASTTVHDSAVQVQCKIL